MIRATSRFVPGFVNRLTNAAETAAKAQAEDAARQNRGDAWRWRMPRLLWPQYTKD